MKKNSILLTKGITILFIFCFLPYLGIDFLDLGLEKPAIWIIKTKNDENLDVAEKILLEELNNPIFSIKLDEIQNLAKRRILSGDNIIIIGHGSFEGLNTDSGLISWKHLVDLLKQKRPANSIILACNSPTDIEANIYGFDDQIDAIAGALCVSWYLNTQNKEYQDRKNDFPFKRVAEAQKLMLYPLNSYAYFVHGYCGSNGQFSHLLAYLEDNNIDSRYEGIFTFSYLERGLNEGFDEFQIHNIYSISDYAEDFKDKLITTHTTCTQIDIVAHSLGGLITREMLRLYRTDLENNGIKIGRVITLGTPHKGTEALSFPIAIIWTWLAAFFGDDWQTPITDSLTLNSPFITTLNNQAWLYSDGIEWYTIAAHSDEILAIIAAPLIYCGHHNDIYVPTYSANGLDTVFQSYISVTEKSFYPCNHNQLIQDSGHKTYGTINSYLQGEIDSDNDGLTDVEELYIYNTDPNDANTDNDAINDGNEVNWGYDPKSASNPIPQTSLIYSKSRSGNIVTVRVNHYSAMDYVKFYYSYMYVEYIFRPPDILLPVEIWSPLIYVGTDYTPYYYGDYKLSWQIPSIATDYRVVVKAYDSYSHYIGTDSG
ncbi:MAG: hypothetical protein ACFFAU_10275 [Candidatus Hodarchaeota archaeon]